MCPLLFSMSQSSKQTQAARHISDLLSERRIDILSQRLTLPNNEHWIILEYKQRQIGIDSASGVWVRESENSEWRCVSMPCTVSGALQAVEFLTQD